MGLTHPWICRSLRIICYLGDLKIAALVDTGSDYDAIDKDLSELQSERNNAAFKGRTRSRRVNVSGSSTVMNHTTDSIAEWVLTISGSKVSCGPRFTVEYTVSLAEFANLGGPVILGMPFVDKYGGLEVSASYVYVADLYINRLRSRHETKKPFPLFRLQVPDVPFKDRWSRPRVALM